METACTYVASGEGFGQFATLGALLVMTGVLASARARELLIELIDDEAAPDPQPSPARA